MDVPVPKPDGLGFTPDFLTSVMSGNYRGCDHRDNAINRPDGRVWRLEKRGLPSTGVSKKGHLRAHEPEGHNEADLVDSFYDESSRGEPREPPGWVG